jgi:GNAT superfamily N-acetyltransferase
MEVDFSYVFSVTELRFFYLYLWQLSNWVRLGRVISQAVKATNVTGSWLRPNRAADPSALTALSRAKPFFAHYWQGPRADAWDLGVLGVDPAYGGRGIGRALVAWGLERADMEGVAASVVSAANKERFYVACGYDEIVGNVTQGDGNPLASVRGGDILFRDRKEVRLVKEGAAKDSSI